MIIEQKQTKVYQPITITLQTQEEAEVIMLIMSMIAGDSENSPRGISSHIVENLMKLGIDYRDENFELKYGVRGKLIFDDYTK